MTDQECPKCDGNGCENGCGNCGYVNAGPNSHKVCRWCGGAGRVPLVLPDVGKVVAL
jgi:hypothetical protein